MSSPLFSVSMFAILIILISVVASDIYLYYTDIVMWKSLLCKLLFFLPQTIAVFVAFLLLFERNKTIQFRQYGNITFFFLCVQIPKIPYVVCHIIGDFFFKTSVLFGLFHIVGVILSFLVLFMALYGCFYELFAFEVTQTTIHFPTLPKSFSGYRIVHISDIHIGSWNPKGKKFRKAMRLIQEQTPDVILFTGDLVNNLSEELNPFYDTLRHMNAKDGVFSVMGNHDYACYVSCDQAQEIRNLQEVEKSLGWKVLLNEHVLIQRGSDSIAILGVENQGRPPFPHLGNLSNAVEGTEGLFQILLSHDPTHWRDEVLNKTSIELTLSGHTHASQVDLPFFSPSKSRYPEYRGLYSRNGQYLYVNIGLGFTFFPIRLGARPEISVLTLEK